MDFLIRRDDLHQCRFVDSAAPDLSAGEALLQVDRFGLTSNNITYAVFGEGMKYWDHFPVGGEGAREWGRMPVWGFAEVADPGNTGMRAGDRVYGYLPPSPHLVVKPDRVNERGFVDAAAHRAELPSAYHGYRNVDSDPIHADDREDEQILFWPLFYTSFLVDDLIADEGFFDARTIVISSASSKTALIAAFLLAQRDEDLELIGLTSPGNVDFVERLGIYGKVATYEQIGSLPDEQVVYADFSGDGDVRAAIHGHFGDRLAHSSVIGATHWDQLAKGAGGLPGPKPVFFFAPDRIKKRGRDWGTAELDNRVASAWIPFAEWAAGWLDVRQAEGPDALMKTYLELLEGKIEPSVGHILKPA